MLTLCMDTAYKYLSLSLIEDGKIIAAIDEECFKKQSEMVFVKLDELFCMAKRDRLAIDSVCITSGPGSYTGVRIAMTIAKTIAEVAKLKLFTISTLRLYSNGEKNTMVIMDARASRAYVGIYDNGNTVMKDQVMNLNDINPENYNVVGDGSLIGKDDKMYTISGAFLKTMNFWEEVKEIDFLVPEYLKESDSSRCCGMLGSR